MLFADVNECAMLNGGCEQSCANIDGSFTCSCFEGYVLEEDNIQCQGNNCH